MSQSQKPLYHFGPFRLSMADRILMRDGRLVEAEPKTVDTLIAFIERRGEVLTKAHLRMAIWGPETFVEPNTVERQVCLLRKILRAGSPDTFIETIPKRGYRFVAPVLEQSEASRALFVAANLKAGILRGIQVVSRVLALQRKAVP
jgi:DNA-binding winged helix-turn-helix (wHTH) protein